MEELKNDPQPWTVVESEYLFRRPWLTARRDHVRLPNGVENPEYYVLEYPNWVNIIARTREGKFILIRQYRHAYGETNYELVAGVIDPTDANPEAAARRELLEETGYAGGEWKLFITHRAPAQPRGTPGPAPTRRNQASPDGRPAVEVFLRHSDCLARGKAVTRPQTAAAEKHSAVRKSDPVVVSRTRNARVTAAERSCRECGTLVPLARYDE